MIGCDMQVVSPALGRYASTRLAGELWKRNDLSPRDRSLDTVAAVIARNQTAPYNGQTRQQASGALSHLTYYAGWPNVFSAAPVFKAVFEQRKSK